MTKKQRIFIAIAALTLSIFMLSGCANAKSTQEIKYEELSEVDQKMITTLNTMFKGDVNYWQDFDISKEPLVLICKDKEDTMGSDNSKNRAYYAVNVDGMEKIENAKKVSLPEGYILNSVYKFDGNKSNINNIQGNFISIGETIPLADCSKVYCLKYNESNFDGSAVSTQFSAFLPHEALHYYMQGHWSGGGSPDINGLSQEDVELLGLKFAVLDAIREEADKENTDSKKLKSLIQQYIVVMEKRQELNADYFSDEMEQETAESTASYVGMKSALGAGDKFGVLAFNNTDKRVTFSDVFNAIGTGDYSTDFIGGWELYNTGLQLCLVMDKLEITDWQQKLNAQSMDKPVTIFSVLQENFSDSSSKQITLEQVQSEYDYETIKSTAQSVYKMLK